MTTTRDAELFRGTARESAPPQERRPRDAYQRPGDRLPPITERQFQRQVEHMATFFRWLSYHTWGSLHSSKGFPDLVLVRTDPQPPRLIFAELKSNAGKLTPEQDTWLFTLRKIKGVEVYVWRPEDLTAIGNILL